MILAGVAAFLTLLAVGHGSPTKAITSQRNCPSTCKTLILPVNAQARNTVFPPYPDSTEPGVMYKWLGSFNSTGLPTALVEGTFNISATYCEPTKRSGNGDNKFQVLLHGLSATKEYWNGFNGAVADFPDQYSWVAHAQSQEYSTLAIDNLGNGQSERPDPVQIVQGPLQLALLQKIIEQLREGTLANVPKFENVVLVTHSYGSILGRLLALTHPNDGPDAYVLTATSNNLTGLQQFIVAGKAQSASAVKGPEFANLAPGYLAFNPSSLRDVLFPLNGDYDPRILNVEKSQPHIFAVGEIAGAKPVVPTNFTGPVMVITGRQDQIVCGNGNITSLVPDCGSGPSSNPAGAKALFSRASKFEVFVPERSAHELNFEYSAGEVFEAAHQFLESVGL